MSVFPARVFFHCWHNCFGYMVNDHIGLRAAPLPNPATGYVLGTFTVCTYSKLCQPLVIHLYSFTSSSLAQFCNGRISTLLLSEKLASAAGLSENDQVILEKIEETSRCTYVEVRPKSFSDWDIAQNSSMLIESVMLNQISVVCEGMSFPIWIGQNIVAVFTVVNISPSPPSYSGCVHLSEDTEIHVQPYSGQTKKIAEGIGERDPGDCSHSGFPSIFNRIVSRFLSANNEADRRLMDEFVKNLSTSSMNMNLRILPRSLVDKDIYDNMHPTAVIALNDGAVGCSPRASLVSIHSDDVQDALFALLLLLPRDSPHDRRIADILRDRRSHCVIPSCLYEFSLTDCTWINCVSVEVSQIRVVKHLELLVPQRLDGGIVAELKAFFSTRCSRYPVVMPANGLRLAIDTKLGSTVKCRVRPSKSELLCDGSDGKKLCFAFACDPFPHFQVVVQEATTKEQDESDESKEANIESSVREQIENFGESVTISVALQVQSRHIASCARYIEYCLEDGRESPGHVLIVGAELSGKSTIANRLARRLLKSPKTVFCACIECKYWRGKSTESVEKQLTQVVQHLRRRMPSILFLENIDFCSTTIDEDQRNLHLERLFAVIRRILSRSGILMVATCKSCRYVHKTLTALQGKRFFAHVEEIESLEEADRLEALDSFCDCKMLSCCDLNDTAMATENFVIGDLKKLSQRIILEATARGAKRIEEEDIKRALQCFHPIGQRAEKYRDDVKLSWTDVGGMQEIKKLLTEVFIWPTKYPSLFRSCAVRPGRGVMLYGPSGTGKTLIAKALASECHFNVITVKGPELLSKYIGQSEESVRNTFERARASKPCLIFFDEFDSLGAKRGHDNTGVTDRVVNQLLTELDGVEELEGVFVLGATNRIDLIDKALLRPGRFDYIIECKLPNLEERLSILKVLCRDVRLESDVDLKYYADKTRNYSGADLKGLVTNAQFHALRAEAGTSKDALTVDERPLIRREDFNLALVESPRKAKKKKAQNNVPSETSQRVTLA